MDRNKEAMLLLDKKELQEKITNIKTELYEYGKIFETFGRLLISDPENISVSDAPNKLGGSAQPNMIPISYYKLSNIENILQLLKDLRSLVFQLSIMGQ